MILCDGCLNTCDVRTVLLRLSAFAGADSPHERELQLCEVCYKTLKEALKEYVKRLQPRSVDDMKGFTPEQAAMVRAYMVQKGKG